MVSSYIQKLLLLIALLLSPLHASVLSLQSGWNLVGSNTNSFNPKSEISTAKSLWRYQNNHWSAISPDDSETQMMLDANITQFDTISYGEGFWVNMPQNREITFEDRPLPSGVSTQIELTRGWNLVSLKTLNDINISDYFDNNMISIVWKYSNSQWSAYSGDESIANAIENSNINQIETLKKYDGFWVLAKSDITIDTAERSKENAIFISVDGDDDNNGSYDAPIKDTRKLCAEGTILDKNIYFRGGIYNDFPMIQCSGTKEKTLEIKPWSNEKVKFVFDDATGIRLNGNYIKLSGIEVEGVAKKVKYRDALQNWWRGDKYYNGSGIVLHGHHIEVDDCIVHHTTGSGISAKGWSNINIHNNIVYDCDWWTISGGKGIGVTDANEVANEDNTTTIKIENNLIFGVESRIFSRVWSKGFAHLDLDEGEGILVQVNDGNYTGGYSIKNNFLLYTGKGIVINRTNKVDVTNNTLYKTGTTISGKFKGIRASDTKESLFKDNSVVIYGHGHSFDMGNSDPARVTLVNNCGNGSETLDGVSIKQNIFANPSQLDFTPTNGCKGADMSIFETLKQKANAYGAEIKPTNWIPDYVDLTKGVVQHIPTGSDIDWSSWSDTTPFDLNITNIPNENIDARPNKFRLEVVHPYKRDDIAYLYGKATEGTDSSYAYYEPASNAIDHNDSTYNHTSGGKDGKNWLEIALPAPAKIDKIILQNRANFPSRLTNAKVYLLDTPYTGTQTLSQEDLIKTLPASSSEIVISINPPRSAKYLLVKGEVRSEDDRHIHLTKLEIYGTLPQTPAIKDVAVASVISPNTDVGTTIGKIDAVDFQGDNLHYTLPSNLPFTIDNDGNIITKENIVAGKEYLFDVTVSDGINSITTPLSITVSAADAVEEIVQSGDILHTAITENELLDATLDALDNAKGLLANAKSEIFNNGTLNNITWDPSHDAAIIEPTLGINTPLLVSNAVAKSGATIYHKPLAIIGEKSGSNYVLFASNPMRTDHNDQMDTLIKNTLTWLTGKTELQKVVIAHLNDGYWFKDETKTREWLDNHYSHVSYNSDGECDDANLSICLDSSNKPDLLIISQDDAVDNEMVAQTVNGALANGIPVFYMHFNGDMKPLAKALFKEVFHVNYEWDNYWKNLMIQDYDPSSDSNMIPKDIATITRVITHLKNHNYDMNWSRCDEEDCSDVVGLDSDFLQGAKAVKSMMHSLDIEKNDIFMKNGYRLQKLLALSADKIREGVRFPLPPSSVDDDLYFRSLFADYSVYNYRKIDPVQPDMGNFSRSDFSDITPTTVTVSVTSKEPFRATGVYCLPGQTMKVTRVDDNTTVATSLFINTLRSGATHEYTKYRRPKFLQSSHFVINSGETIYITSPYGGPVEIAFDQNDINTTFRFENVGQHPFWKSPADDIAFANALNANKYDWAELATGGFEVHSKLDKMKESIENWADIAHVSEDASELARGTREYIGNLPFAIAGFKGDGISVIQEVKDWADNHHLTIHTVTQIKHMNADQASCGYGCSGNPYDAYWAFNPIGHGDLHEVGHGLEGTGIKFDISGFHSTTNPYSYYTKTVFNKNTDYEPDCQNLPFKQVYAELNASATLSQSDRIVYLNNHLWKNGDSSWDEEFMVTLQAMMQAQKYGELTDGYDLLALNHIIRREANSATWESKKNDLGFSDYSDDEYANISPNDFSLVALSYIANLDYRPFFDMFGLKYSEKASTQVDDNNPANKTKKVFFVSTPDGYCKKDTYGDYLDKEVINVDGSENFPY